MSAMDRLPEHEEDPYDEQVAQALSARWWNVNEEGQAYDDHDTEAQAREVNAQFPNDVVVRASSAQEAEARAFPHPEV